MSIFKGVLKQVKKALFLDRDGVINKNSKPINSPEDFKLYVGVKEALRNAEESGFELFIVTNQGGIELGFITVEELNEIHNRMLEMLKPYCTIREVKYCPDYHKDTGCRKPKPNMILELCKKYNIDIKNSYMIGDMDTDIEAGKRAGCRTAKIGKYSSEADINGKDLFQVVQKIISKINE
jgi:D-glycero-D-manno-heptose 1,7-bisphosphate phosphatase